MKKIMLLCLVIVLAQIVSAAQDPAPYFCETQGYKSVDSFIIQYNGKDIQLLSDTSLGNTLFMLYFKEEGVKSHPYNPITDVSGLSEIEKNEFIEGIKNEISFGNYKVEKVATEGYEGYLIQGKYELLVYCNFPNGNSCSWEDFKNEKCGVQYRKEIPCVKEGDSIRISYQECCDDLSVYNPRPSCEGCLPVCQKYNEKEPVQEELKCEDIPKPKCLGYYVAKVDQNNCPLLYACPDSDDIKCRDTKCPNVYWDDNEQKCKCPPSGEIPESIKEAEIIDNDLLFYFYSETCQHCSGMDNELNKVKEQLEISVVKSDVTKDSDLAKKYGIRAVPSLVFIKEDGSFIKREGKTDYFTIIDWIKSSSNLAFEELDHEKEIKEEVYDIPVEEEEEKEVTHFCSGCLKDNKCYPFGYRKSGDYCSDSEEFVAQSESGKTCDNNFECRSNVCIDGECISGGLLRQILDWLSGLFGG
jgi:thioredoxin-related protein